MKPEIRRELEELAPGLAKLDRPDLTPELPDNYFHNLTVEVLQQARDRAPAPNTPAGAPRRKWSWWFRPGLALATVSAAIALVVVFWPQGSTMSWEEALAEFETDQLEAYISDNIEEFDEENLARAVLTSEESSGLFDDIEGSNLENYLEENSSEWDEELLEEFL